ncbi:MAG: D-alanyl-D-alanine carboxypeptidase [Solirubrobacteraceae bacterium]|nr:D-alanyl-D-alanine carboxypeptidase [Solirubrobacteraceae bacterium]
MACSLVVLAAAAPPATAGPPSITAPSAAVIETSTGTVVYTKNANAQRSMASTTKLMTALVALDEAPLSTVYSAIDYGGSPVETRLGLVPGEKMTLADLVRAMLLPSANDAAQTVAVRVGGTKAKFVRKMNAKAEELGLKRTGFANSIGLDAPGHQTTALELAKIGVAAHNNPFIAATVKRKAITLKSGRTIVNRNRVLGTALPGGGFVDGMKTGHTASSGYSLVGSATRNGVTVVSVVLGDPTEAARDADTVRLLRWASGLFTKRTLVREQQRVAAVPVIDGKAERVSAVARKELRQVVPRGARVELVPTAMSPGLPAPVAAGVAVGTARVLVNDKEVGTVALETAAAVEHQGTLASLTDGIAEHWKATLAALVLLVGGTLTLLKARRGARRTPPTRRHAMPAEQPERSPAP